MQYPARWFLSGVLLLCVALASAPHAGAKMSKWKDVQGTTFKGEPTDILGPFAVFHTGAARGRRVPLRVFSPEECLLIQAEIAERAPRAGRFADAKGGATGELVGNVQRIVNRTLVPADLSQQPEPELLLVLGGSHNDGEGWFMSSNLNSFYWRVQRVYPGLLEGVFFGTRHDVGQHRDIALNSGMPWLVSDLRRQGEMGTLNRYLPTKQGATAMLLSRQGVPLAGGQVGDVPSMCAFVDHASEVLWQIDPANPASWPDRLHYLNATRLAEFAQARAEPVLVGSPLRPEVLRKYGVKRVAARLAVAADGKVTPTLLSGPEDVPPELAAPLTTVLAQVAVAPAIDHGRPVAGSLDYALEVPPADPVREAEHTWLGSTTYPALPIPEWLVLRPIQVSEQDFESSVIGEKSDGTVILNAFEVNSGKISRKAQMSAFNSDWFAETGAGSVHPKPGDRQEIGEAVLTWEKARSTDGFVNMQSGILRDYTVGYAWAEFESPKETEAWLGLGSDDGVKIWLNGGLVHDKWIRRPSRVDDEIVPVQLKKGANRILIKIQNATGDWSFVQRLRLKP